MSDDDHLDDGRAVADDEWVRRIADAFGLGPVTGWSDVGGGWTTNLRLDRVDAAALITRIHARSTTLDRVRAEQSARSALSRAGVPTVVALGDHHDDSVIMIAGRAVEVEPFVSWTDRMNTPDLVERGLSLLATVHDVLRAADLPPAAHTVAQSNHIAAGAALDATRRGAARLRGSGEEELVRFADEAEEHVRLVAGAEAAYADDQVVQVVHGDFWDNNVLFSAAPDGPVVSALLDFGFMGRRPRVDDLALTVWFWLLKPATVGSAAELAGTVARWLDAYDAHTDRPLSAAERASLPLAVARQPAWSIGGWVLRLDEANAYRHARECVPEQPIAAAVLRDLAEWQDMLTG